MLAVALHCCAVALHCWGEGPLVLSRPAAPAPTAATHPPAGRRLRGARLATSGVRAAAHITTVQVLSPLEP